MLLCVMGGEMDLSRVVLRLYGCVYKILRLTHIKANLL